MSGESIAIDLNGEMVDLSKVDWYLIAPCGCTAGATVGWSSYKGHVHVVATAQQADESFHDTAEERAKWQRLGFTIEPGLRSEVVERMHESCPHDPKWGYSIATPEGMTWASNYGRGRLHLVPEEACKDGSRGSAQSLCGRARYSSWTNDSAWSLGLVECSTCESNANRLAATGVDQ